MTTVSENISLIDINETLSRLWDVEIGKDKIRACLFNLIVYTEKTARLPFFEELIKKVIGKFPCRILWIKEDSMSTESYLKTSVETETISAGEAQLFCEMIKIETTKTYRNRLPSIILPHLLPDLPIYAFWTKDPSQKNEILDFLEKWSHRILFDSQETEDLQAYGQKMLELLQSMHCHISDLNWVATRGLRHIFSQVFNSNESLAPLLHCKTISIVYNKNSSLHTQSQAIRAGYFQAWLAAQFNWKFQNFEKKNEKITITYRRALDTVSVFLSPFEDPSFPPDAILSIEIESHLNKAHYCFKRVAGSRQVVFQYSDNQRCDLPHTFFLIGFQEGQEIIEEIFHESSGIHYKNMLQYLSQIPWKQ